MRSKGSWEDGAPSVLIAIPADWSPNDSMGNEHCSQNGQRLRAGLKPQRTPPMKESNLTTTRRIDEERFPEG